MPKGEPCKYGDPYCPCQDGDLCHYEGENPMSPDSDVAAYARRVRDIDSEHRSPHALEKVAFVTRPALFCGACGAAVMQQVFGPVRREVWCAEATCVQHGKRLNVFDPIIRGEPHE